MIKTCSFKNYLEDFEAKKYPDYFGADENYELKELDGKTVLVRNGSPYLRNIMLVGSKIALEVGNYYKLKTTVKLVSFAQTDGAVKILRNASPSYPWSPVSEYSDPLGDWKNDYSAIATVTDLLDGGEKEIEFTFKATAPYLSMQTPGYVNLIFTDFTFEDLGTDAEESMPADFSEYTQVRVSAPDYKKASPENAALRITLTPDKAPTYSVNPDGYTVAGNKLSEYVFLLPRVRSYLYTEALNKLSAALSSVGITLGVNYDDDITAEKYIAVGNTKISKKPEDKNAYSVYAENGTLYIAGGSDLAVYTAVSRLADMLSENAKAGKPVAFSDNAEVFSGVYSENGNVYNLTFDDEFDGDTVNTDIWTGFWGNSIYNANHKTAFGTDIRIANPVDGDVCVITKDTGKTVKPLEIVEGQLHLRTILAKEIYANGKKLDAPENSFVGACLSAIYNLHFKYGVMEVSYQIAGGRTYDSIWANGDVTGPRAYFPDSQRTAFCEIDLTESFGYGDYAAPCVHKWWNNGENYKRGHNSLDGPSSDGYGDWREKQVHDAQREDFLGKNNYFGTQQHIYSFAWTPDNITLAVDGKVLWDYDYTKYTATSICNLSKHFIITSGESKAITEDEPEVREAIIDFVRLYQIPERGDKLIFAK